MTPRRRLHGSQSTDAWRDAVGQRSLGVYVDVTQKRGKGGRKGRNQYSDAARLQTRALVQQIGRAVWEEAGEEAAHGRH